MKKEYLPTYYEVVTELNKYEDHNFDGRGGRWEKAEQLTIDFEEQNRETDWPANEVDWFEAISIFVHNSI